MLIAGPTASGKSALALALAEKLGGIIVNADSMQVYRDLRVITARPSAGGRGARAAPALRPCRRGGELFGRAMVRDVAAVLDETRADGRVPILVGGTGLYFKALTEGLAAVPPVAGRNPRPGARALARAKASRRSMPNCCSAIRKPRTG